MSRIRLQTLKPRIQMAGTRLTTLTSWRTDKQTSGQRGYNYRWQQARERFLRAHPLCLYCEREGRITAATVVDHRIPHRGDERLFWDESNWQALCAAHHSSEKQREEIAK